MNVNGRMDDRGKERRAGGIATAYRGAHLVLLLMLLLPCSLPAQSGGGEAKLKGRVVSTTVRKRNDGPVTVIVQFDHSGSRLVEGMVELGLIDPNGRDGGALYTCVGPEVALTTGTQSFRVMLPYMPKTADGQVMARLTLRTKEGPLDLGSHQVAAPEMWPRTFVLAVVEPMSGANPDKQMLQMAQSLRFERFDPDRGNPKVRRAGTALAYVTSEEAPQHPLAWCSYDVVVLPGPSLALLRERQVEALRRWVEGGGSLCVGIDVGLKDYHRKFLNALAAGAGPVVADKPGGGVAPAPGVGEYALLRPGVGRAVVLLKPPAPEAEAELRAWREIAAFLWRVRKEHLGTALDTGLLPLRPEDLPDYRAPRGLQRTGLEPAWSTNMASYVTAMLPKTTRLIPFGLVIALLSVFLVIIGPADYFLLGWLKRRRYTWVTLPLVCVGFTALMVLLADHYMGRRDHRSAVTIIDVGPDNRPVRQSRIEVLFAGSNRLSATALQDALFTPVSPQTPAACSGRAPAAYAATQPLRQWQPQLNRTFSLDPPHPAHKVRWEAFTPPKDPMQPLAYCGSLDLANESGGVTTIIHYGEARGSDGSFVLTTGHVSTAYTGRTQIVGRIEPYWPSYAYDIRTAHGLVGDSTVPKLTGAECFERKQRYGPLPSPPPPRERFNGLFDFVAGISPSNSPMLEDLFLSDPSDPDEWIVCVVFKVGDGHVVYRKVYRTP
jgi:hypothetical protein